MKMTVAVVVTSMQPVGEGQIVPPVQVVQPAQPAALFPPDGVV